MFDQIEPLLLLHLHAYALKYIGWEASCNELWKDKKLSMRYMALFYCLVSSVWVQTEVTSIHYITAWNVKQLVTGGF